MAPWVAGGGGARPGSPRQGRRGVGRQDPLEVPGPAGRRWAAPGRDRARVVTTSSSVPVAGRLADQGGDVERILDVARQGHDPAGPGGVDGGSPLQRGRPARRRSRRSSPSAARRSASARPIRPRGCPLGRGGPYDECGRLPLRMAHRRAMALTGTRPPPSARGTAPLGPGPPPPQVAQARPARRGSSLRAAAPPPAREGRRGIGRIPTRTANSAAWVRSASRAWRAGSTRGSSPSSRTRTARPPAAGWTGPGPRPGQHLPLPGGEPVEVGMGGGLGAAGSARHPGHDHRGLGRQHGLAPVHGPDGVGQRRGPASLSR